MVIEKVRHQGAFLATKADKFRLTLNYLEAQFGYLAHQVCLVFKRVIILEVLHQTKLFFSYILA